MSLRTRRLLAALGMAWIGGVIIYAVLADGSGLAKLAYVLYGGFGLIFLGSEFFDPEGRWDRPLRWGSWIVFITAGVLLFLGAIHASDR